MASFAMTSLARTRPALGIGALILALASCGQDPREIRAIPRTAVARAGAGLPGRLRFQPPADGLLTDAQLDRYVKVRRATKGRSDDEAAGAVGADPDEVAWVRARVDEALLEADRRRIRASADDVYGKTLASLRETRKSVKDEKDGRALDEQIAGLERERASLRKADAVPPSIVANAKRVLARRAELETKP
jgi:hypothetical protein